jgi:predicted nuclease of predicted toxin-antitoxin system
VRFLADESCDHRVVVALRAAGHDVVAITETAPGSVDADVLANAVQTSRVLLTEDRDFGQLVFSARMRAPIGVLYIRCPEAARPSLPRWIVATILSLGPKLEGRFCTWKPGKLRLR